LVGLLRLQDGFASGSVGFDPYIIVVAEEMLLLFEGRRYI
jgi:hypothetical protein